MTPEQIISGIIIGSLTTFLVNWLGSQVKIRLPEALGVGILGAWAGELMLSHLLVGTQVGGLFLFAGLGAFSLEIVLFAVKIGWHKFQKLRHPHVWSFVQPFEE